MNGIVMKMVDSKLVVEIDLLRAIVEDVNGAKPRAARPGPKPAVPKPPVPAKA